MSEKNKSPDPAEHERNLARIKKLMGLTFSDNDHEALLALRKVNEMLKASNITWEYIFDQVWKPKPRGRPAINLDDMDMDDLVETLMRTWR